MAKAPPEPDPVSDGPDWPAYYERTLGRPTRPVFDRGMAAIASARVMAGQAVEIGFGDGTETLALLAAGWWVFAVDPTPDAADGLRARVPAGAMNRLEIVTEPAQAVDLPPFELLYAGFALSFIAPSGFPAFWERVRSAMRPGAFLVANIFGVHDTWAGNPTMTFLDAEGVAKLLRGLDVVSLDVTDADGDSFSGRKHWHIFDIVARASGPSRT